MTTQAKHTPAGSLALGYLTSERAVITSAIIKPLRADCKAHNDDATADLRALIAERDAAVAQRDELIAAMQEVSQWESDGRPTGVHIMMQGVRAAIAKAGRS